VARTFTKNAANYVTLPASYWGSLLNGAGKVSVVARVFPRSYVGASNNNRVFTVQIDGTNVTGLTLLFLAQTISTGRLRAGGRSLTADAFQTVSTGVDLGVNAWISIGALFNFTAGTITIYTNGALVTTGTPGGFGSTTYVQATPTVPDVLGGSAAPPPSTTDQFDGDIAEFAIYAGDITLDGHVAFNEGYTPDTIRPDLLASYIPLLPGVTTPQDYWQAQALTITGSIPEARHPITIRSAGGTLGHRVFEVSQVLPATDITARGNITPAALVRGGSGILLFARSGIARSGATRSGYFYQNIVITIGGVDMTSQLELRSLSWEEALNEAADTANMRISGAVAPRELQSIAIALGSVSNPVFAGTITGAKREPKRTTLPQYQTYAVEASDWSYVLAKTSVYRKYASTPAHIIFLDLAQSYAPGFTANNVQSPSPTIGEIEFSGEDLPTAFTRVGRRIGWSWYPAPEKDLHFSALESQQGPKPLTVSNPDFWAFESSADVSQLRTRVRVQGGGSVTTADALPGDNAISLQDLVWYTDNLQGEADRTGSAFALVQAGGQVILYTLMGVGQIVGVPSSGFGSITHRIPQGTNVNIHVVVDDPDAIADVAAATGTDGIFEFPASDERLNYDGCVSRGEAELLYSRPVIHGSYETFDRFARSGKKITINLPLKGVVGDFLITNVSATLVGPGRVLRKVTFASAVQQDFYGILRRAGGEIDAAA
jgi:hypothetical protein